MEANTTPRRTPRASEDALSAPSAVVAATGEARGASSADVEASRKTPKRSAARKTPRRSAATAPEESSSSPKPLKRKTKEKSAKLTPRADKTPRGVRAPKQQRTPRSTPPPPAVAPSSAHERASDAEMSTASTREKQALMAAEVLDVSLPLDPPLSPRDGGRQPAAVAVAAPATAPAPTHDFERPPLSPAMTSSEAMLATIRDALTDPWAPPVAPAPPPATADEPTLTPRTLIRKSRPAGATTPRPQLAAPLAVDDGERTLSARAAHGLSAGPASAAEDPLGVTPVHAERRQESASTSKQSLGSGRGPAANRSNGSTQASLDTSSGANGGPVGAAVAPLDDSPDVSKEPSLNSSSRSALNAFQSHFTNSSAAASTSHATASHATASHATTSRTDATPKARKGRASSHGSTPSASSGTKGKPDGATTTTTTTKPHTSVGSLAASGAHTGPRSTPAARASAAATSRGSSSLFASTTSIGKDRRTPRIGSEASPFSLASSYASAPSASSSAMSPTLARQLQLNMTLLSSSTDSHGKTSEKPAMTASSRPALSATVGGITHKSSAAAAAGATVGSTHERPPLVLSPPPPPDADDQPVRVAGVAYRFDPARRAWTKEDIHFTVVNPLRCVGKDDLFVYFAADAAASGGELSRPAPCPPAPGPTQHGLSGLWLPGPAGGARYDPAAPAVVKVFRSDVCGVTVESDYFAQAECAAVSAMTATAWADAMARRTEPKATAAAGPKPAVGQMGRPPLLARPTLPSVEPYLRTRQVLVRVHGLSVASGVAAEASAAVATPSPLSRSTSPLGSRQSMLRTADSQNFSSSAEPGPRGARTQSFFSSVTADSVSLLCLMELGTFLGARGVADRAADADPMSTTTDGTSSSAQVVARPGTARSHYSAASSLSVSPAPEGSARPRVVVRRSSATGSRIFSTQDLRDVADALSHLSFSASDGALVLANLREGCVAALSAPLPSGSSVPVALRGAAAESTVLAERFLTDPVVHANVKLPRKRGGHGRAFGRMNGAARMIQHWARGHRCNSFCADLGLMPLPQAVVSALATAAPRSLILAGRSPTKAAAGPETARGGKPGAADVTAGCAANTMLDAVARLCSTAPYRLPAASAAADSRPGEEATAEKRRGAAAAAETFPAVLYHFERGETCRWVPASVLLTVDLTKPLVAAPASATGHGRAELRCLPVQLRLPSVVTEAGAAGQPSSAPTDSEETVTVMAYAFTGASADSDDAAYFAAAGERVLLQEMAEVYNKSLAITASRRRDCPSPLQVTPRWVLRVNRNRIQMLQPAASAGVQRYKEGQGIFSFPAVDSEDVMLLVEPLATSERHVDPHGSRAAASVEAAKFVAGEFESFCSVRSGHAISVKSVGLAAVHGAGTVTEAATKEQHQPPSREGSQARSSTGEARSAAAAPPVFAVVGASVHVCTAQPPLTASAPAGNTPEKPSTQLYQTAVNGRNGANTARATTPEQLRVQERLRLLSDRLSRTAVYSALHYRFDLERLRWVAEEAFICVPTPERGIGIGAYRVCFEVLEAGPGQPAARGGHAGAEAASRKAHRRGTHLDEPPAARGSALARIFSSVVSPQEHKPTDLSRLSPSAAAAPHGKSASSQAPRSPSLSLSSSSSAFASAAAAAASPAWAPSVAKMFKRNACAGAGLPITERNYFFEAAKQNFSACIARDFDERLGGGATSFPRSRGPLGAEDPESRNVSLANAGGHSTSCSSACALGVPHLTFIPASVVTMRYDLDLPQHLCYARKGFFSYRCSEMRKLHDSSSDVDPRFRQSHRQPHQHCMCFTLEPKLDGQFSKYISNDEKVFYDNETPLPADDDARRKQVVLCAEALAHFSWQMSSGGLLLCDLQGVGTALTDPEIHTLDDEEEDAGDDGAEREAYKEMLALDGRLLESEDSGVLLEMTTVYLAGNGGRAGIDLFLQRHKCNSTCAAAGLTPLQAAKIVRKERPMPLTARGCPASPRPGASVGEASTSGEGGALVTPRTAAGNLSQSLMQQYGDERVRNHYLLKLKGVHLAAAVL